MSEFIRNDEEFCAHPFDANMEMARRNIIVTLQPSRRAPRRVWALALCALVLIQALLATAAAADVYTGESEDFAGAFMPLSVPLPPDKGAGMVTASFCNWNDDINPLDEIAVPVGEYALYEGDLPEREGYTFTGWSPDPEVTRLYEDTRFTAQFSATGAKAYEEILYTLTVPSSIDFGVIPISLDTRLLSPVNIHGAVQITDKRDDGGWELQAKATPFTGDTEVLDGGLVYKQPDSDIIQPMSASVLIAQKPAGAHPGETTTVTWNNGAGILLQLGADAGAAGDSYSGTIVWTLVVSSDSGGNSIMVWIPTISGVKYHSKSTCSNMKNPIQVTIEDAIWQGFGPCSKCYPM